MQLPLKGPFHPSLTTCYPGLVAQPFVSPSLRHFPAPTIPLAVTRELVQQGASRGGIDSTPTSNSSLTTSASRKASAALVEQATRVRVESVQGLVPDADKYDQENALPDDFKPGQNSVIIGRKKNCYTSVGNLRLRDICLMRLPAYSKCGKKKDKSEIVTDIVKLIRDSCPRGGAFVKRDASGKWHEVKDVVARERVASIFRDFLHDQYRSSSKSKVAKRREKRVIQVLKPSGDRSEGEGGGDDASYSTSSNQSCDDVSEAES